MSIDFGSTEIQKIYLGGTEIFKVYKGSTLTWEKASGLTQPTVVESESFNELALTGAQPANRSFTCPSGTTKLLLFVCSEGLALQSAGVVTYAGSSMTLRVTLNSVAGSRQIFVFSLDSPTTGSSQTLAFSGWTAGNNRPFVILVAALANAAAGTFATTASSEATGTTPITQVLNFADATSLGLYCIARNNDQTGSLAPAGSGQVQVVVDNYSTSMSAHLSSKAVDTAGNYTFSTTTDGVSEDTPRVAIEIAGSGTAEPPPPVPTSGRAYSDLSVWNIPASEIGLDTSDGGVQVARLLATCNGRVAVSTNTLNPGIYYADANTPRLPFERNASKPLYATAYEDDGWLIPFDPNWPTPLSRGDTSGDCPAIILETDTGRQYNLMFFEGVTAQNKLRAGRCNFIMSRAQWPYLNHLTGKPTGQPAIDWPWEDYRTGDDTSSLGNRVTNIPFLSGLVTKEEFEAGVVNHALAQLIWKYHPTSYRSPAWKEHSGEVTAPDLGARFILDLTDTQIDECINTMSQTNAYIRKGVRGMLVALREYGCIGSDGNYNNTSSYAVEGQITHPAIGVVTNIGEFNQTFFARADVKNKWKLLRKASAYSTITTWNSGT